MKRIIRKIISIALCISIACCYSGQVYASPVSKAGRPFYDTEYGRVVTDLDEYMRLLNSEIVKPYEQNRYLHDSGFMLMGVEEPSKKCSNIFGHKWGPWGSWYESYIAHSSTQYCVLHMYRTRLCTRTHCGAYQDETDVILLTNCSKHPKK